eukprot:scaffold1803_cov92-Amphora_coffeaeformis.AAC.80
MVDPVICNSTGGRVGGRMTLPPRPVPRLRKREVIVGELVVAEGDAKRDEQEVYEERIVGRGGCVLCCPDYERASTARKSAVCSGTSDDTF